MIPIAATIAFTLILVALAFTSSARAAIPVHPMQAKAAAVICTVFGKTYCRQALEVSWCESRWWTYAHNGQYLGLFQMGDFARSTYGHGGGAWRQARAAHRYFVASGRDWSPWSCKP